MIKPKSAVWRDYYQLRRDDTRRVALVAHTLSATPSLLTGACPVWEQPDAIALQLVPLSFPKQLYAKIKCMGDVLEGF